MSDSVVKAGMAGVAGGAIILSPLGPIGSVVGGIVGGVATGIIEYNRERESEDEAIKKEKKERALETNHQ